MINVNIVNRIILFLKLLVFALLVRLLVFFFADNIIDVTELEAYSRVNLVLNWLSNNDFFPDLNFSPLYFYVLKYVFMVISDPLLGARVLSLIFGVLLVIPYLKLIENLFSKKIGFLSVLIFIFFPLVVRCSVVSLPVIIYVFFIISSLWIYFLSFNSLEKEYRYLLFSALLLTVACGFRFEGFLFVPLLSAMLFLKCGIKKSFIFFFIAMIVPSIYMKISFSQTGYLLSSAKTSAIYSSAAVIGTTGLQRVYCYFNSISQMLSFYLLIPIILGAGISFYCKKGWELGLITIIYMSVFVVKAYTGTFIPNLQRYFLLIGLLLLPYAFLFLEMVLAKCNKSKIFMTSFCLWLIVFFIIKGYNDINQARISPMTIELTSWLKRKIMPNDIVVLDRFEHPYLILEGKLKEGQFFSPVFTPEGIVEPDSFNKLLLEKKSCYLVCKYTKEEAGIYKNIFSSKVKNNNFSFRQVFFNNYWRVYKVN